MTAAPTIAYITSSGHSGSTLLDVLISSHSSVVSVGEIMRLRVAPGVRCSCAAKYVMECPFWQRVDSALQSACRLSLGELYMRAEDDATFVRHNSALFDAVAHVAGKPVIVDSSKNVMRLARLLASGSFAIVPIHLVRQPQGVVYSQMRKGRSWLRQSISYARVMRRTRKLLRHRPHARIHYDDLARDPRRVLEPLMSQLRLQFEPQQLQWAGRERHNFGGNRMRRSRDSTIRPDNAWEHAMPAWQRAAIALIAGGTAD
jgi:hypothetical protein